jgi:hypothetical protein
VQFDVNLSVEQPPVLPAAAAAVRETIVQTAGLRKIGQRFPAIYFRAMLNDAVQHRMQQRNARIT